MNGVFIDTNIFYNILFYTDLTLTARRLLETHEDREFYTSITVVNELLYIATRRYYQTTGEARGAYSTRRLIVTRGYPRAVVDAISGLLEELEVKVLTENVEYRDVMVYAERLRLLPSDTIIALTCRYYGLDTILTFDSDFKRVPWLRVVP